MYDLKNLKLIKNKQELSWDLIETDIPKKDLPEGQTNYPVRLLAQFYDSDMRSKSPLGKFLVELLKQVKENLDEQKSNKEE